MPVGTEKGFPSFLAETRLGKGVCGINEERTLRGAPLPTSSLVPYNFFLKVFGAWGLDSGLSSP